VLGSAAAGAVASRAAEQSDELAPSSRNRQWSSCRARAAKGHATALPPNSAMNSRRSLPDRTIFKRAACVCR
jgi:hypothetical protein